MSPTQQAILGIVILLVLMLLEMPVAFAMFAVGFLGLWMAADFTVALNILGSDIWLQLGSYGMSVVPLFVFMGNIAFRTGVTNDLFDTAFKWIGQFRGGLAATTIAASTAFGAICGSNGATTATMGTIALPIMKKYKYDDALACGAVATGGTLGVMIPPSVVLIIVALQTNLSIAKLFIATIPAGIMLAMFMIAVVFITCARNKDLGPAGPKTTWLEKIKSVTGIIETLILFIFVMAGMFLGWFTPTEGGAFGSAGAIIIGLIRRKLKWDGFKRAVMDTISTSTMVVMLVAGAVVLGRFLTYTRLPQSMADWVSTVNVPRFWVLMLVILVYVVGGALTDALGFLTLSVPVFFPLIIALGYDPIWFAVLVNTITTFGAITPPVGLCLYIVKGLRPEVPIQTIFKGAVWFMPAFAVTIALLIAFPQIITGIVSGGS
jgi:tripartite ATP-independent transporter DctM subunit